MSASVGGVAPVAIRLPTHIAVFIICIHSLIVTSHNAPLSFHHRAFTDCSYYASARGSLSHLAKQQNAAEEVREDNTHRVHARHERSGVCTDVSTLLIKQNPIQQQYKYWYR